MTYDRYFFTGVRRSALPGDTRFAAYWDGESLGLFATWSEARAAVRAELELEAALAAPWEPEPEPEPARPA